jgi:hypothetical protein
MRQKTSIEIFNYWDRIRGSADAPLRNAIEPSAIRHILPQLFILELMPSGETRFRLAGTMICNLFGRELREHDFTSLWTNGQSGDVANIVKGVMVHAVPTLLNATGYNGTGRSLSLEIVLMPVRSAEDRCDRLLGCLVPTATMAWVGVEPLEALVLDRSRLMQEWSIANTEAPLDARLPKSVYVGRETVLGGVFKRVLHLRIFDGDRVD